MYFGDVGIPGSSDYYCGEGCEDNFVYQDEFQTKFDQDAFADSHAGPHGAHHHHNSTGDHDNGAGHHEGHHGHHGDHDAHGDHAGQAAESHGSHGAEGDHSHSGSGSHHGHSNNNTRISASNSDGIRASVSHITNSDFDVEALKAKYNPDGSRKKQSVEILSRAKRAAGGSKKKKGVRGKKKKKKSSVGGKYGRKMAKRRRIYDSARSRRRGVLRYVAAGTRFAGIIDRAAPRFIKERTELRVAGFVPIILRNFVIASTGSTGKQTRIFTTTKEHAAIVAGICGIVVAGVSHSARYK
jgi:hypothetical protein